MKALIKINNPEYYLLLLFGIIYFIFFLHDNHGSFSYNYQYFLYDYHFGFIKRGLIGSLLNLLPFTISEQVFANISLISLIFLGFSIIKIINYIDFNNKFYGYFLISLLLISPALFKNLWFDLGRLDIFGILFCLLFIFPFKRKIINIIFLISPFILFVHEGFFLLWLPTYFICWFIKNEMVFNRSTILNSVIFIFISLFLVFFINKFGNIKVDFATFQDYLISKTNDKVDIETNVITDSMYFQIYNSFISNFTHFRFWFLGFINLFSIIYVMYLLCRGLGIHFFKYKIIFIPIFFSFLMFFLGIDALRWFSNMCFSLYLIFLCIFIVNKEKLKRKKRYFIMIGCFLFFCY